MLKQFIASALFAVGLSASAQGVYQFKDPGFETGRVLMSLATVGIRLSRLKIMGLSLVLLQEKISLLSLSKK